MPKGSSFCSGPTSRRHTGGQYDRHMEDNPEQKNGNFILKCKYFDKKKIKIVTFYDFWEIFENCQLKT